MDRAKPDELRFLFDGTIDPAAPGCKPPSIVI